MYTFFNFKKLNKKFVFLFFLLPIQVLDAQEKHIVGQVKSREYGNPVEEVEIWSNDSLITATNHEGKFSVPINLKEVVLRKSGYLDERVRLDAGANGIALKTSYIGNSHTVEMLYRGKVNKKTVVGAVTEVYSNQLIPSNSRSTAGLLSAFVPGLYTSQSSTMPTADAVSLSLRGGNPLVILDGVPQSFAAINPEQIESITFLKDAVSTAMLGMRASDGVMLIKTKSGLGSTRQQVSVRLQSGMHRAQNHIKPLNAYDYATLYNEARQNDGLSAVYDDQALEQYKNNTDSYSYPNHNWYDEVMNQSSRFERYDVSLQGGGKAADYFVNLNYYNQEGLFKNNEEATYNTGVGAKKYSFRSNTNINLTDNLVAGLKVAGQFQNTNQPGATASTILANVLSTPALAYPAFNANGSLGGTVDYLNNIYGQNFLTGYRKGQQLEYKVDVDLKANLSKVTEGLWMKVVGSYYNYMLENISRIKTYEVYEMEIDALGDTTYNRKGNLKSPMSNSGSVTSRNSTMYGDLSIGFNRRFYKHGISALANINIDNAKDNAQLAENYKGLASQINYDFDNRYMVDVVLGYNGVERFAKGKRYGFFPAFGLGWNIAQEDFAKKMAPWVGQLKIRGSYGLTGAVTAGRYTYLGLYEKSGSYSFGTTIGNALSGITDVNYNANVSWEKAKKLNIGVDFTLFRGLLSGNFDYFNNKFYDILQSPNSLSAIFGDDYPLMNIGKIDRKGLEAQLNHQNSFNQFKYFVQVNYGNIKSVNTFFDEPSRLYPWQVRTGTTIGSTYGYIAEGLFASEEEARNAVTMEGYTARAGDIKYKDLNGDGIIDSDDQTTIGSQKPVSSLGLVFGFDYKGFDFSGAFQGVFNREILWTGNSVFEFLNNGLSNAFEHHLDRWTAETATTATYPRLSVGNNINNQATSTYWLRNGDFIRLKNIELGYTLPSQTSRKAGLSTIRFFFNGSNLFTWSKFRVQDPESFGTPYPMTSIFSGGLNIKF